MDSWVSFSCAEKCWQNYDISMHAEGTDSYCRVCSLPYQCLYCRKPAVTCLWRVTDVPKCSSVLCVWNNKVIFCSILFCHSCEQLTSGLLYTKKTTPCSNRDSCFRQDLYVTAIIIASVKRDSKPAVQASCIPWEIDGIFYNTALFFDLKERIPHRNEYRYTLRVN
jgi:hypothetical protein